MVFLQIVIGGVTRLTDSGLSITEWAIIQGTIPPINETEWQEAFDMYKVAAKRQFEMLHADMTLDEFKVIFYWEYFHRLWARLMGFVFLMPFLFFWRKKWIPVWLMKGLGVVILLAILAAVFGWIMVDSGLNNHIRTRVDAYALVVHLGIASALFGTLFWLWMQAFGRRKKESVFTGQLENISLWIIMIVVIQILFGGLMAGMRAGLLHPHAFLFIEFKKFLSSVTAFHEAKVENLIDYEPTRFIKAVVQTVHRLTAWILLAFVAWFFFKLKKVESSKELMNATYLMIGAISLQILLGIVTVINSVWKIPVVWGAIHQAGAFALLASAICVHYFSRKRMKDTE